MYKILDQLCNLLHVNKTIGEKIIAKAISNGECVESDLEFWFEQRFSPNIIFISKNEYAEMCIDALKIVSNTAPTDYGSSRQRDFGQLWADMIRGYLGEMAVKMILKDKWNIQACLGHERGELQQYLPMDIHRICKPNEKMRNPNLKISIKATKWNGIWFDIPGNQFMHSDIHILVRVGVDRDHLFSFFKEISIFKDKILGLGKNIGVLSANEADELYRQIPSFQKIPCYVCGFVSNDIGYKSLDYIGRLGRKNFKIKSWNGPIQPDDLDKIMENENIPANGKIEFEGIGRFSHHSGYLFNTGKLLWKTEDWDNYIINKL